MIAADRYKIRNKTGWARINSLNTNGDQNPEKQALQKQQQEERMAKWREKNKARAQTEEILIDQNQL